VDVEIRTIAPEEFEAYIEALTAAFGDRARPEDVDRERKVAEIDRCLAALDGDEIVGGASASSFTLTVPGGFLRAAGVTGVGVKPTHRRRGINTALMRRQLDDVRAGGERVAVLYASEGSIYGRYGYGIGSFRCSMDVERGRTSFVRGYRPSGRTRLLERENALKAFLPLYDRARTERPGGIELDLNWFEYRFAETNWGGESRKWFYAAHEGTDGLDAYAVYDIRHGADHHRRELVVEEVQAVSPQGYADIWRYLFDVDLIERITARGRPLDEPLVHLVREPEKLQLKTEDALWVRLVDLPRALEARRYGARGRVTFEVRDPFCPWNEGRYALEGGPDGVACEPTQDDPEIVLTVNELGAAYLGGVSFRQLYRAGRIAEERTGALARADAMFAWDPAPWCSFVF
jgi:predicted acetyltransferase